MRCPHDDDPQSCPPCQDAYYYIAANHGFDVGPVFAARYTSTCPACEWPIDLNDECRIVADRTMHRTCAEIEVKGV